MIPLVNGRAYDFAQIVVTILGVPLAGVSAISYAEEQEKTNNFGQGNRPVSRGQGAIDASGSITISMNDVEALRDVAPDGSLLKIPAFDPDKNLVEPWKKRPVGWKWYCGIDIGTSIGRETIYPALRILDII